jgi:ABC-type anion transport system duplicated permease subunit
MQIVIAINTVINQYSYPFIIILKSFPGPPGFIILLFMLLHETAQLSNLLVSPFMKIKTISFTVSDLQ